MSRRAVLKAGVWAPSLTLRPVFCCSWVVADAVSAALAGAEAELRTWREKLLECCVKWLVGSFGGRERDQDGAQGREEQMLLRFCQLLVGILPLPRSGWWSRDRPIGQGHSTLHQA